MSAQGGAGWPALGVWLCLSVACTGAYDRPLPLEFVPGEFVAVGTDEGARLYRVGPDQLFQAYPDAAERTPEIAFDGTNGVALWRFPAELLSFYEPSEDKIFTFEDSVAVEVEVGFAQDCECMNPVLPSLVTLAPGSSCPLPRFGSVSAGQYEWDDSKGWGLSASEPRQIYLSRKTLDLECERILRPELFLPETDELWSVEHVELSGFEAVLGVLAGMAAVDGGFIVFGSLGRVLIEREGRVTTLEAWPEDMRGPYAAVAQAPGGRVYLLKDSPPGALGRNALLITLAPGSPLEAEPAFVSESYRDALSLVERPTLIPILKDAVLAEREDGEWIVVRVGERGVARHPMRIEAWYEENGATPKPIVAHSGTVLTEDGVVAVSDSAWEGLAYSRAAAAEWTPNSDMRSSLLSARHVVAYSGRAREWRFTTVDSGTVQARAESTFDARFSAPACAPEGSATVLISGKHRVAAYWAGGGVVLAGSSRCFLDGAAGPLLREGSAMFDASGRILGILQSDGRVSIYRMPSERGV